MAQIFNASPAVYWRRERRTITNRRFGTLNPATLAQSMSTSVRGSMCAQASQWRYCSGTQGLLTTSSLLRADRPDIYKNIPDSYLKKLDDVYGLQGQTFAVVGRGAARFAENLAVYFQSEVACLDPAVIPLFGDKQLHEVGTVMDRDCATMLFTAQRERVLVQSRTTIFTDALPSFVLGRCKLVLIMPDSEGIDHDAGAKAAHIIDADVPDDQIPVDEFPPMMPQHALGGCTMCVRFESDEYGGYYTKDSKTPFAADGSITATASSSTRAICIAAGVTNCQTYAKKLYVIEHDLAPFFDEGDDVLDELRAWAHKLAGFEGLEIFPEQAAETLLSASCHEDAPRPYEARRDGHALTLAVKFGQEDKLMDIIDRDRNTHIDHSDGRLLTRNAGTYTNHQGKDDEFGACDHMTWHITEELNKGSFPRTRFPTGMDHRRKAAAEKKHKLVGLDIWSIKSPSGGLAVARSANPPTVFRDITVKPNEEYEIAGLQHPYQRAIIMRKAVTVTIKGENKGYTLLRDVKASAHAWQPIPNTDVTMIAIPLIYGQSTAGGAGGRQVEMCDVPTSAE